MLKEQVVIISAETSRRTLEHNALKTLELRNDLDALGVRYNRANGYYKNRREDCFVCIARTASDDVECLKRLAWKYQQECLLYRDATGITTLHYWTGKVEVLGRLREVPELTSDCVELNGRIYAA